MCGINGYISNLNTNNIVHMNNATHHRGPDNHDYFSINNVTLGHNRLSIHDLSNNGSQPMHSKSKKWVIVFNGEIYNFKKLREKYNLETKSQSDTEVLVELIDKIGIKNTLNELIGMFAFAALDKENQNLYLARDRAGEKPLYYYKDDSQLIFSSELKAVFPLLDKIEIKENALRSFFYYNYIPESNCILKNTEKVSPGEFVEICCKSLTTKKGQYWHINQKYEKLKNTYKGSFDDAVRDLDKILTEVVEEQLESDVPIGCFLSGGVDSSIISAIAQKISNKPINTFSIGFDVEGFNEAEYAKEVANSLKTNHTELYASPQDCINLITDIAYIYDEPFADSSQLPTLLLSRLTKEYVTVCLSGDGGDEVFGGYNRYFLGNKIQNICSKTPSFIRKIIANTILSFGTETIDKISPIPGDKLHKLANVLNYSDDYDFYEGLITHWKNISPLKNKSLIPDRYTFNNGDSFIEKMMLLDFQTYMCSDIFTKVDRSSMSTSLETRAPLVDQRVVEFAMSLPLKYKVNGTNGKYILKEVLYKYINRDLIERPKMGFGIPIEKWLRYDIKDWAAEVLARDNEFLDHKLIQKMFNEHIEGKRNWGYLLWDVIIFQEWYKNYIK